MAGTWLPGKRLATQVVRITTEGDVGVLQHMKLGSEVPDPLSHRECIIEDSRQYKDIVEDSRRMQAESQAYF
jgi:hypothetical protein